MSKRVTWRIYEMAATLLIQVQEGVEEALLMGPKVGGALNGFMSPVGGKIEFRDQKILSHERTVFTASCRECREESGFTPLDGVIVAKLTISILGERRMNIVHVVRSTQFTGELKVEKGAFLWLKFLPISQIPWNELAPGDEGWMKRFLINGEKLKVIIRCGKNRADILSVHYSPL